MNLNLKLRLSRGFAVPVVAIAVTGLAWGQAAPKQAKAGAELTGQRLQIDVRNGSVIYAAGDDLVVKMSDGSVKHVVVPSDFRFQVDGKSLATKELKPGMQLTQVIATSTKEEIVTTVRNVDATVRMVAPPYLTVATADGEVKQVKVPQGTTFTIDGQQKNLGDLKEGMKLTGTVVTRTPTTVISSQTKVGGTASPTATPVFTGTLLIEEETIPAGKGK